MLQIMAFYKITLFYLLYVRVNILIMWKTPPWPHHFTKRAHKTRINPKMVLRCQNQASKVSVMCAKVNNFSSDSMIVLLDFVSFYIMRPRFIYMYQWWTILHATIYLKKTANVGIEHQSINGERRRFILKTSVGFSYEYNVMVNLCWIFA